MSETWTDDGARFVYVDYDERDVAEVTREALRWLLDRAGFMEAEPPKPPPTRQDGRARLREVAARQTTTPTTETRESAGESES